MVYGGLHAMTLAELKDKLKSEDILSESFYIFLCKEDYFVANQYIDALCDKLGLEKLFVNSIFEQNSAISLVMPMANNLKILYTDEFTELTDDYSIFTNTVVVCTKLDKKVAARAKEFVVEFPKLTDWQIKDYIKTVCPGLLEVNIETLYNSTKGNIYRINNELDKIKIFPIEEQSAIFAGLESNDTFLEFSLAPFTFIDLLLSHKQDFHAEKQKLLMTFFKSQKTCKYNIYSLINNIMPKLKGNLLTRYYGGRNSLTAEDLEMSPGQFYNISQKDATINYSYLVYLLNTISEIDLKIKSGELDLSAERQLDYFVTRVLNYVK